MQRERGVPNEVFLEYRGDERGMHVTRFSILSGTKNRMYLPITYPEFCRWQNGAHAQTVWPQLSPEEREFLISGITPAEWTATFGRADD